MKAFLIFATAKARTAVVFLLFFSGNFIQASGGDKASLYEFTLKDINGKDLHLSKYKGKVLLIVNVASECGYTPQYKELELLYRTYKDKGFVILGFPANNFGAQEPGTETEIKTFCEKNYGVTFDLFSKISVMGDDQHPLYRMITSDAKVGGEIRWNFQKYLVDRDGNLMHKFPSRVKPMSDEIVSAVEAALE